MEPLVTAAEMRECDAFAIKTGIPGIVLMENAGRGVAMTIERNFGPVSGKRVLIFCGKGNNGGDGFVTARHLLNFGAHVTIFYLGKASRIKGDAKTNLAMITAMSKKGSDDLHLMELTSVKQLSRLERPDILVDALFGTGFSGKVKTPYNEIIHWMNNSHLPVVSVDVPSGVNADNGEVADVAVRARLTVTMGFKKIGLVVGSGSEYANVTEVEDIGIPRSIFQKRHFTTFLITRSDVKSILPRRPFDAHKHSVGKIFVIAGSRGLTGAAAMVSQAAMRMGAGAVVLGTPTSVYPILAKKLTEVMVEPLEETSEGSIGRNAFSTIEKFSQWADVIVLGPGLSRNPETQEVVQSIVRQVHKPLLIDADGLNALAENTKMLKALKNRDIILTPHTGELSRLMGLPSGEIERERVAISKKVASEFGVTLVLKGAPTVTATPAASVFVNSTGNPGMATAGSGDVLSGIIAALWAQGLNAGKACYAGVYIHGLAGDIAREAYGQRGLLATDILAKSFDAVRNIEKNIL